VTYKVLFIPPFDRQLRRLAKKYPSLKRESAILFDHLGKNPLHGEPLGHSCYKIRLAIASKGKGKSGGARVITFVHVSETSVYLLAIYDKSEKETLSNTELFALLRFVPA